MSSVTDKPLVVDAAAAVVDPPLPEVVEPDPLARKFLNVRTLLSFALGIGILALVMSRIDVEVDVILAQLARANPWYYVAGLLVYHATFLIRGLRWRKLLENVGFHRDDGIRLPSVLGIAEIIVLSWFANCIVPAKLGDAYRAYLLKRAANVSFAKTFGTILAERMIDMLLLFALLGGAVLFAFRGALPPVILGIMQVGLVLVGLVVVGLFAMRLLSGPITRMVPGRFRRHYGLFEQGTLRSFQALPLVLLY